MFGLPRAAKDEAHRGTQIRIATWGEVRCEGIKYWEIIADNLSRAGWSWGCVSAVDSCGRTIWIADANRGDAKRFVVRGDEKLTAFLELETVTRESLRFSNVE